jgi:hypothetical protein
MRLILVVACLVVAIQSAHAAGRLAEVLVIDRDSGTPLRTYYHRGEYWVAGNPGARYAIEIRNTLHQRVLAVASVDGINVLTGDTARWDQSGYVLHAEEAYEISGWRKSQAEVAAFEFTAMPNSYAARTGRSANIGVIGVALFRERVPAHVAGPAPSAVAPPAPPARESGESSIRGGADVDDGSARSAQRSQALVQPAPLARLGTGHGAREQSYVVFTDFTRATAQPNEVVRIRYDSRENLLALGIIPRAATLAGEPNPFPGSSLVHFVPDPPACNGGQVRQCVHDR